MRLMMFCLAWLPLAAAALPGTVQVDELNVRIQPDTRYTAVSRLIKNNPVEITAIANGSWYQIELPKNGVVWIARDFLRKNRLTATVHARSGPGSAFESYGSIPGGTTVELVPGSETDEWVRVRPRPGMRAYVGSRFIQCDRRAAARLPRLKFDARRHPPVDADFVALEAAFVRPGKAETKTGVVAKLNAGIPAITHVLYEEKPDALVPYAYLYAPGDELKALEERRARLGGMLYTVKGSGGTWELPVLVVEKVRKL